MGNRTKIVLAFSAVSLVLIWLLVGGFDAEEMQYYISIKELQEHQTNYYDRGLRVKGKLVAGSHEPSATSLERTFKISEEGYELDVRYNGLPPDTFKDGAEVVVEGTFMPAGYFVAQTLMAKCPSKYESTEGYENIDQSVKESGTN